MDQFTEVVSTGWLSRIGGAIVGVLFGIAFCIGAFPLLWWNEGRAVRTYQGLQEGAAVVVESPADVVSPATAGKLVHVSGLATTQETLRDPTFGVSAQALRVRRRVQMYQWVEDVSSQTRKKWGGGEETVKTYSYSTAWREGLVRSASFKDSYGHENPASLPYDSATFGAASVTLGAHVLPGELVSRISATQPLAVPAAALDALNGPARPIAAPVVARASRHHQQRNRQGRTLTYAQLGGVVGPRFFLNGDGLYRGTDPGSPRIGDLRISFEQVPPTPVSIVATQSGNSYAPYRTAAGSSLYMLKEGFVPAPAMFSAAETENTILTWILRVGGFVLLFLGINMVFRPLVVVADVIPFLGSILGFGVGLLSFFIAATLSMVTIAIAWIAHRPLLGGLLLAGALGGVLAIRAMKKKSPPRYAQAF